MSEFLNRAIMKKILCFFGQCAYVLGSVGGFGYALYSKAYLIAVCVAVLAVMAFPTAKKWYHLMMEDKL